MEIPLKDCKQCSHYRGGFCYGFGTAKRVFSTTEAIICGTYTPLGQVQIGPLDSLAGQLKDYQIPSSIISTAKLADAAVTLTKLSASSVNDSKVTAAAAIAESKLNLAFGTTALNNLISTNITDIASNLTLIQLREEFANKDAVNGYLGLDASAKVPLSKLNPLLNAQIDAAAAILESKLNLAFGTSALNTDIQTKVTSAEAVAAIEGEPTVNLAGALTVAQPSTFTSATFKIQHSASLAASIASTGTGFAQLKIGGRKKTVSDLIGALVFIGDNSADEETGYSRIYGQISDPTDGSEDGNILFYCLSNGALTARAILDALGNLQIDGNLALAATKTVDGVDVSAEPARITAEIDAKVSDVPYDSSWDAVTDVAPSKNATYDALLLAKGNPQFHNFIAYNGATISDYLGYGWTLLMPSDDAYCGFSASLIVPENWVAGTTTYLNIKEYHWSTYQVYSGLWYVSAFGNNEFPESWNILNGSSAHDFTGIPTAYRIRTLTFSIGDTIVAGDRVAIKFQSDDVSNASAMRIFGAWLSW